MSEDKKTARRCEPTAKPKAKRKRAAKKQTDQNKPADGTPGPKSLSNLFRF